MRKILTLAAALLLAPAVMAEGEVYRWKDANGLWHYSDQPQPGAELVKKPGARSSSSTASSASTTPAALPAAAATESNDLPVSREVAQQVRQEADTARSAQCKTATEEYQSIIAARRVYKDDGKGGRVFLNNEEIDAARLQARAKRDLACGPSR